MPEPVPTRRPRRSDGEARREALLAAAVELARTEGFAQLTTRAVARAAGVGPSHAFHYWPTRNALVAEAFSWECAREVVAVRRAVARRREPLQRLWAFIHAYAPPARGAAESYAMWVEVWSESRRNPEFRAVTEAAQREWVELLASLLADLPADAGLVAAPVDELAQRVLALVDGVALGAINGYYPMAQARRFVEQGCVDLLGVAPPTARSRPGPAA